MDAYGLWQQALVEEFFGKGCAGQSLALYVDDEVAEGIKERRHLSVDLVDAVASEIDWKHPSSPFRNVVNRCHVWKAQGQVGPPPSLPVLASTVLAATHMATSDRMLRTNYYGRWAQLFGMPHLSAERTLLERTFDEVVWMWQSLDEWLEATSGLYGSSTIDTDNFYWRIGYPLSQALIRTSDREELTRFFSAAGLTAGNPAQVPGRELVRRLKIWTTGRDRKLTPRLLEEVDAAAKAQSGEAPLLAVLLERLARQWDGTLHEPGRDRRRRAAPLQLLLGDRGRRLEWTADVLGGLPATTVGFDGGRTFTLEEAYGSVYSGLEDIRPSDVQLKQGIHLAGDDLVLDWTGREAVLFRLHAHLGDWVSTEYFAPGEDHWVLASKSATAEVRSMVNSLRSNPAKEAEAPLPGWTVFKGIRALDGALFGRTLDRGGTYIHILEPPIRERASLTGGLRIQRGSRVDRVIVGEARGAEVVPMFNAMSQGNDGSISTIHSSSSRGVFTKFAAYTAQSPERLSLEATNLLVASAVHFVVHLERDTNGRRCVSSIREVVGADGVHVVSNEVFAPGPDRRAVRSCQLSEETQSLFDGTDFDQSQRTGADGAWARWSA